MKDKVFIESEDSDYSSSCHLLLELNEKSYNFAVVKTDSGSLQCLASIDQPFKSGSNEIPAINFSKISISTFTKSFVFIPESEFSEGLEASFMSFLQVSPEKEELFSNFMQKEKPVRNIYALDRALISDLSSSFENARIFTQVNSLYEGALNVSGSGLFVNFKDRHIEVLLLKEQSLQFYNAFEFQNEEEILYFLLLTAQQKGFSPKATRLYVSGQISLESTTYKQLALHFPNLAFSTKNEINISQEFGGAPLHQFFTLFNLYTCA